MKKRPEWERYAFTIPKSKESSDKDRLLLSKVYHVAHLPTVRRILEDRRLRAGLVSDESKLNRSRTCVTWLSAKKWPESIYGNVQFTFDWAKIIEDRQVYWVEAMTDYETHACRFLLTDRDMSKSKYVVPYNPKSDEGPLRKRKNKWYWNGQCTSQFMLEDDVFLRDCTDISFMSHHHSICRLYGPGCKYRTVPTQRMAGRVLAFLLSSDLHAVNTVLVEESQDGTRCPTSEVQQGASGIWWALGSRKKDFCGGIKRAAPRQSVLRGALALYSTERDQAARDLISLLHSQEVFEKALTEIIEEHFDIEGYQLPG